MAQQRPLEKTTGNRVISRSGSRLENGELIVPSKTRYGQIDFQQSLRKLFERTLDEESVLEELSLRMKRHTHDEKVEEISRLQTWSESVSLDFPSHMSSAQLTEFFFKLRSRLAQKHR